MWLLCVCVCMLEVHCLMFTRFWTINRNFMLKILCQFFCLHQKYMFIINKFSFPQNSQMSNIFQHLIPVPIYSTSIKYSTVLHIMLIKFYNLVPLLFDINKMSIRVFINSIHTDNDSCALMRCFKFIYKIGDMA